MIVFDLKCENDHQFESWFSSSASYADQQASGLVVCPYCESQQVIKAPMAPNIGAKSNQKPAGTGVPAHHSVPAQQDVSMASSPGSPALKFMAREAQKLMHKMQEHIEKNCENVGENFAEEARKIHYGETEERGIYGSATVQEAKDLIDEGVEVVALPGARRTDA